MQHQIRFEVKSILGKKIRTTEGYWELISEVNCLSLNAYLFFISKHSYRTVTAQLPHSYTADANKIKV